jgi:ACR3 family arsenite efflux pump ArsB
LRFAARDSAVSGTGTTADTTAVTLIGRCATSGIALMVVLLFRIKAERIVSTTSSVFATPIILVNDAKSSVGIDMFLMDVLLK